MKKNCFFFFFVFLITGTLYSAPDMYRYGIFVSSSKGFNENDLPGAAMKAREVGGVFRDYCLLNEALILEDPDPSSLDAAFDNAREIAAGQRKGTQIQFFFYYYGHGLPSGLLLNYKVYRKQLLKEKIEAIGAHVKIVFLDACSSQVLSTDKELHFSTPSKGTVYITSSTQFQKSFTEVFTPILKAGLMGDADGFIPRNIDAPFFYNEIKAKLDKREQEMVSSLYGLSEYYRYNETSPAREKRLKTLFTSLGIESVPGEVHITDLDQRILSRINNTEDEKLIRESYNYNQICTLTEPLSGADKESLTKSLAKAGIVKDNYVTLSELFSYIQTRIAEKNVNNQRPTITTGYLSSTGPIRLSYFYNKVPLRLKYPGTIFINKVGEDSIVKQVLKIIPTLDKGDPVTVALEPGVYTIIVETDKAKYAVDVTLKRGEEPVIPEKLDWENLTEYRKDGKWKEKGAIDAKMKLHKKIGWIPPAATFTALAIPLSVMLSDILYYHAYLALMYKSSRDPDRIDSISARMDRYEAARPFVYVAVGLCFTLPVTPLVIWIIRAVGMKKLKNELKSIKNQFVYNSLPGIYIGAESVAVAVTIRIK